MKQIGPLQIWPEDAYARGINLEFFIWSPKYGRGFTIGVGTPWWLLDIQIGRRKK